MLEKTVLALIRGYQKVLSPDRGWFSVFASGPRCRFHPTCSEYTYLSVERFGVIRGVWLGVKRIGRCHPWHPGGYDPPPKS